MKTSKILLLVLSAGLLVSCGGDNNSTTTASSSSDAGTTSSSSDAGTTTSSSDAGTVSSSSDAGTTESSSAAGSDSSSADSSSSGWNGVSATLDEGMTALGVAYYNVMTNDKIGLSIESDSFTYSQSYYYTDANIALTDTDIDINVEGLTATEATAIKAAASVNSLNLSSYSETTNYSSEETISHSLALTDAHAYLSNSLTYLDLSSGDNLTNINNFMKGLTGIEGDYFANGKTNVGSLAATINLPLLPASDPIDGQAYDSTGAKINTLITALLTQYGATSMAEKWIDVEKEGNDYKISLDIENKEELIELLTDSSSLSASSSVDSSSLSETINAMVGDFGGLDLDIYLEDGYLSALYINTSITDYIANYGVNGYDGPITSADDFGAGLLTIKGDLTLNFNYGNAVSLPSDLDSYEPFYVTGEESSSIA